MKTLLMKHTGPLVQYDVERQILHIADLNPEVKTQWLMARGELFAFGWRCIRAALAAGRESKT